MYMFICLLSFSVSHIYGTTVPFITPCKAADNACLVSSAQAALPFLAKGIPEIKYPPAVPIHIKEELNGDQGDLKLRFWDISINGPDKCKFLAVNVNQGQSTLDFAMECPIDVTGKYSASGKLLFVPIEGNGDIELKTEKIKFSVKTVLNRIDGSDGKQHYNIDKYDYSYEPMERIYIDLKNLFNGDEAKAKPILEILNHSWKELIVEIGQPVIKEIIAKVKDDVQAFLHAVPAEELFLP